MTMTIRSAEALPFDPIGLLRGLAGLRRLTGMYPAGHPAIEQKLSELNDAVQTYLRDVPTLCIDVIHGLPHVDGLAFRPDGESPADAVRELTALGIDSVHIRAGVTRAELLSFSEFLWQYRPGSPEPIDVQLAKREIHYVSIARLVPLDTRWRAVQWPDAPSGNLDPAYAESLALTEETFAKASSTGAIDLVTVRRVVDLLMQKVATSSAALGQILSVKLYENLTYCHSVNVATLSLLIGRNIGLDQPLTNVLAEAALLHDIGKTRIPLELLRKPGVLDRLERRLMEAHTTLGAGILSDLDGIQPLAPTVALEHHRGVDGTGYPNLGTAVPHVLSQIVSVADIYEAMTGARSYQDPAMPEQACLVLARLAGTKLNTALVKAFVNAISFFPVGSVVRTDHGDLCVVLKPNAGDPLHPVVARVSDGMERLPGDLDTSERDSSGGYICHVLETLRPPDGLDVSSFLSA
jgi:putative nucleotidyltransferase with HDIG domain